MNLRTRIAGTVAVAGLAAILAVTSACGGDSGFALKGKVTSERHIPGVHYFTLKDPKHGLVEIGMDQGAMVRLAGNFPYSGEILPNNVNVLARAKNLVHEGKYDSIPAAVDSIINPGVCIEVRFDAAPPSGTLYYNADQMFLPQGCK